MTPNAGANGTDHKSKYALATSHVVTDLIKAYDAGDTLNFTKLKSTAAKKYKLQGTPKLADILQALPISYRNKLRPYLQTKPVRTASGVAVVGKYCVFCNLLLDDADISFWII
jgi:elongator complex protein 3